MSGAIHNHAYPAAPAHQTSEGSPRRGAEGHSNSESHRVYEPGECLRKPRAQRRAEVDVERTLNLFGFRVFDATLGETARLLVVSALCGHRQRVSFVNAHCINVSYRDETYRHAVATSDLACLSPGKPPQRATAGV